MEKIHTREEAQLLFSGVKDFDKDLVALGNFQESPYFSTPESEKRKWSVEKRKKFEEEKQRMFSKSRLHGIDGSIELAIGGSDAATPFNLHKYETPLGLYLRLAYPELYMDRSVSKEQEIIFGTGHRAEPYIRESFELATGLKVIEWDFQMVNKKYPHCIADVDGLVCENGKLGIYEGKCLQFWASQKNWQAIKSLKCAPEAIEYVPAMYRMQVWYYLAVTGLSFAYICGGGWGFRLDDIGYCRINRLPPDKEAEMMETLENFVQNTIKKIRPTDIGSIVSAQTRLKKYTEASIRHRDLLDTKIKKLPKMAAPLADNLLRLEKELEEKRSEVKAFEKSLEIKERQKMVKDFAKDLGVNEIESKIEEVQANLASIMFGLTKGMCQTEDGRTLLLSYDFAGRKTFDSKLCKEKYPEIYEEVYRIKNRLMTVTERGEAREI